MTMVNKLFKVVTYRKKSPPIHSHYSSIRCSCEVTKRRLIDTKQSEMLAYFERLPLLKPHDPLNHVTNVSSNVIFWKNYISTFTRLVSTKLAKVLTYLRRFSTLKLSPTSSLYICCQLSVSPNKSVRICPTKLKLVILCHMNNTFRNTVF